MNADHLRPMLENSADAPVLSKLARLLCEAKAADVFMVKAKLLCWRSPTEEPEVLREKPVGSAYNFRISEGRVARGRTVVRMPTRFISSAKLRALSKSRNPLAPIVGARPHLTPLEKDESVEQEWRGA